ncbi:DUF4293 domain-containing protein [Flammeovirga sp. SubArs3]|uniref:DUF4293 domain-containing protein n=1 Tax=Flammeovirga sp. SubArs3 TaxID=2995316 RepID=UPI00248B8626|nr:DUF4293 domain-containing protein [Flammeovirga sp. SubArs3]
MIQRIQSIFLFLIAVAMTAVIFAPIWAGQGEGVTATLTATELTIDKGTEGDAINTIAIAIVSGLSAVVALFSLISFNDRMKQVKINLLNAVLIFAVIGLNMYYGYMQGTEIVGENNGKFEIGFFLPVFAIVFNSMANRFIQRDEKKVRDSISGRLRD